MENTLEVKDISVNFDNFSLKDVSFNVKKGTIMGFIGENGAGKTTTLKLILNSFARENGSINVFGKDNIKDEIYVKNYVGYVPAESYLLSNRTILQHEETFSYFYDNWDKELFRECLRKWKIDKNMKASELSTGMKTKTMLALALAHEPQLLILDEPTAGLDPVARMELLDELRTFVEDGEKSIIISTHITSDLDKVADYITLIHNGRILESDSIDIIQERYAVVRGEVSLLEENEDKFVGVKKWDNSFEGLILRENLIGDLKKLQISLPNIEELLTFHIWGNK
ncbi:ABC transporter ATP-binding protein [Clostridium paraputrificum]|uniref:ABC transporter ATP-binding protein n=1 Tax=Clostridium TaxID=1485 RepID=UPI003D35320C